jgi:hypothetical protein
MVRKAGVTVDALTTNVSRAILSGQVLDAVFVARTPVYDWPGGGMADAQDLKSCARIGRAGSIPAPAIKSLI